MYVTCLANLKNPTTESEDNELWAQGMSFFIAAYVLHRPLSCNTFTPASSVRMKDDI
jgi:hypothetical protein